LYSTRSSVRSQMTLLTGVTAHFPHMKSEKPNSNDDVRVSK